MAASGEEYNYEYYDIKWREYPRTRDMVSFIVRDKFSQETLDMWIQEDIKKKMKECGYTESDLTVINTTVHGINSNIYVLGEYIHCFFFLIHGYTKNGGSSIYHAIRNLPDYYPFNNMIWFHLTNLDPEVPLLCKVVDDLIIFIPHVKGNRYQSAEWAKIFMDRWERPQLFVDLQKKAVDKMKTVFVGELMEKMESLLGMYSIDLDANKEPILEEFKKKYEGCAYKRRKYY